MYAEVDLTLLTCCFSIDIYSFLYQTQVNIRFYTPIILPGYFSNGLKISGVHFFRYSFSNACIWLV